MSTTGTLEMDSQDLAKLSNDIGNNAQSLAGLNNQFKSSYERITSDESWIGDDSKNFAQVSQNLYNDLEKIRTMLEDAQANLSATSSSYDETNSEVNGMISGML